MKKISKKLIMFVGVVSFILGSILSIPAFAAGPATIDLLSITTNNFVILGQTAITDANPILTSLTGNVGLSAAAGSNISGLSCTEVAGSIYDVDGTYTGGHDSNISCLLAGPGANKTLVDNAVLDMGTAYVDGNTRTAATGAELNIGGGTLNGQNFVPGLYTWTSNVTITGDITLTGNASDIWIFQINGTLDLATNKQIILAGGAVNSNIFWVVTGATTLFPSAVFRGTILDQTSIAMQLGAVLEGRALAQTAVTLIGSDISTSNTSIDTNPPVITRLGLNPTSVLVSTVYTDSGATALDDIDGNITANIVTVNPVNTAVIGTYTVTYNVSDAAGNPATQVTRTVNVIASVDNTPPVITVVGSSPISLTVGDTYTDSGATALDDIDGNITANIVTVNPVDEDVVGIYTITYNVSDSSGNATVQKTRTVNVVARTSSGSSSGGTHFGCKDPKATNYEYFAASKPSLCVYSETVITQPVITSIIPTPVINTSVVPSFPNTGFAPKKDGLTWKGIGNWLQKLCQIKSYQN